MHASCCRPFHPGSLPSFRYSGSNVLKNPRRRLAPGKGSAVEQFNQLVSVAFALAVVLALFLAASLGVLIPLTLVMVNYYLNLGAGDVEAAEQSLTALNSQWPQMAALVLASIGIYVYSIVDAYRQAKKTHFI